MPQAANFEDILSGQTGTAERPKPLPPGSYLFQIVGQPRFDKSQKKQTPFVEFTCQCMQALDDVDQNDLEAAGGVSNKKNRLTFYLTEDSLYRLDEFLKDHLGLGEGMAYKEAIAMTPGRTFIGQVVNNPSEDGSAIYANITRTTAA